MANTQISRAVTRTSRSGSEPKRMRSFSLHRIARGRTRWLVDGERRLLREGEMTWIRPGEVFGGIESSEGVVLEVESLFLEGKMSGSDLADLFQDALAVTREEGKNLAKAFQTVDPPRQKPTEETGRWFGRFIREGEGDPIWSMPRLRTGAGFALFEIGKQISGGGSEGSSERLDSEADVALFLATLEDRCAEDWTLESMAEVAGLKRSRFGTLCRRLTGESPMTYLNRLRIRQSRRLLRETEETVTDIAFACGFSSSQYFAKLFRRYQGHEPTHYRQVAKDTIGRTGVQYLKGESARTVAYTKGELEEGDFAIEGTLLLERLGGTAASLEFGPDRFGFDGREGRFFLEGTNVGDARFFNRSTEVIHEGEPFQFCLRRRGRILGMTIEGESIFQCPDDPKRKVGEVGLRPLRNGIRVLSFLVNGEEAPLRERLA